MPESVSIDLTDGRRINAVQPETPGDTIEVTVTEEVQARSFESCPICWAPATVDEHVPPESIGGAIMTRTCGPCNHRLGSHVEADLADWWDNALTLPRFSASVARGSRRSSRILLRTTPAGEVVLFMDGGFDAEIIDMLNGGRVDLTGLQPDRNRYRIALLKQAYLAACMKFGIPRDEAGDEIRHDLIAARDAPGRRAVPLSQLALGLTVLRRDEPIHVALPPVVWAVAQDTATSDEGVLLAGRVFISWPPQPARGQVIHPPSQVHMALQVDGRVDGTVSSVDAS
jgi:hypothetical protein